jgi:hypothetical protein
MNLNKIIILAILFLVSTVWTQDESVDESAIPPRGGKGTITIETNPPGSMVYLGGVELGKTPIKNLEVSSGRQTLVVIDQGQELINERFNVWPNKNNEYKAKTVMPFGSIEITTTPGKCDIYLNGDLADGTDGAELIINNVDAGDHMIKATCGRHSKEEMITVVGEQRTKIHIDATKK